MTNIIEIKNLTKDYPNKLVLDNIDLDIAKGQIFCLLGPNGAGKTTIIRILTTLITKYSGSVSIDGLELGKDNSSIRSVISATGQYSTVDELLTAEENMMFISNLKGVPNKKQVVEELLKQFDLFNVKDKKVSEYSGGMKRRLDIALSLIGNPKIIFLDEPTTGLDPQSRISLWKKIKELRDNGITIFLTTQYLEEAEALAEKIAILNNGKIVALGTNSEIRSMINTSKLILEFESNEHYTKSLDVLSNYKLQSFKDMNMVHIELDTNIDNIIDILITLKNNNINITFMEQSKPSLEDVFLEIVKDGESNEI